MRSHQRCDPQSRHVGTARRARHLCTEGTPKLQSQKRLLSAALVRNRVPTPHVQIRGLNACALHTSISNYWLQLLSSPRLQQMRSTRTVRAEASLLHRQRLAECGVQRRGDSAHGAAALVLAGTVRRHRVVRVRLERRLLRVELQRQADAEPEARLRAARAGRRQRADERDAPA